MVEVGDVLGQHATQVPLVHDQHVIQTFGSDRSNPSLRDGVGLGRSERGAERCDAQVADSLIESRSITIVAVVDEKARWLAIPNRKPPRLAALSTRWLDAVSFRHVRPLAWRDE